jgi:hypothetical protein
MTFRATRKTPAKESALGEKLLRSVRQARDWVNGKTSGARVTYVVVPHADVRKTRGGKRLGSRESAQSLRP